MSRTMKTNEWGITIKQLRKSIKRALSHPKLKGVSIKSIKLNKKLTKEKATGKAKVYTVVYNIKDNKTKKRKKKR